MKLPDTSSQVPNTPPHVTNTPSKIKYPIPIKRQISGMFECCACLLRELHAMHYVSCPVLYCPCCNALAQLL